MAGGNARRLAGTNVVLINHLVQWFQAISAKVNVGAQRRALAALWKAAFSVFTNEGDDGGSLNVVEAAPVQGDLRRVEYSAEMAEIGFLLEVGIEGTLPGSDKIDLTSSGLQGVSQTSG